MAAGVGKTFRMLLEGQAELEAGRDVVIGLLETHGRKETAQLAEGLSSVPRRRVGYREAVLEEMDLPEILRRADRAEPVRLVVGRPAWCLRDRRAPRMAGSPRASVTQASA